MQIFLHTQLSLPERMGALWEPKQRESTDTEWKEGTEVVSGSGPVSVSTSQNTASAAVCESGNHSLCCAKWELIPSWSQDLPRVIAPVNSDEKQRKFSDSAWPLEEITLLREPGAPDLIATQFWGSSVQSLHDPGNPRSRNHTKVGLTWGYLRHVGRRTRPFAPQENLLSI